MLKRAHHALIYGLCLVASASCGEQAAQKPGATVELDGEHFDDMSLEAEARATEGGLELRFLGMVDTARGGATDQEVFVRVDLRLEMLLAAELTSHDLDIAGEALLPAPKSYPELGIPLEAEYTESGEPTWPAVSHAAMSADYFSGGYDADPFTERVSGHLSIEASEERARGTLTLHAVGLERSERDAREGKYRHLFGRGVDVHLPFDLPVTR